MYITGFINMTWDMLYVNVIQFLFMFDFDIY